MAAQLKRLGSIAYPTVLQGRAGGRRAPAATPRHTLLTDSDKERCRGLHGGCRLVCVATAASYRCRRPHISVAARCAQLLRDSRIGFGTSPSKGPSPLHLPQFCKGKHKLTCERSMHYAKCIASKLSLTLESCASEGRIRGRSTAPSRRKSPSSMPPCGPRREGPSERLSLEATRPNHG